MAARFARLALAVCLSLFTVNCSLITDLAQASGPGTTTGEILKIPIGTRAVGMGEAFTALADDASALYWNPAGLAALQQKEASFMHSTLIESIHYEHMAFVAPGDSYALGGAFSYLGYGDIAGYDNSGAPTGNLSAYSYIATGGLARQITPALSLGMTGSFLRQVLDADSANTFATNAGALYRLAARPWNGAYTLGASILNVGPGLKFISERDPLPRKLKFGAAASGVGNLPVVFTADLTAPNDNDTYLSLGSEYSFFQKMLALRLGWIGSNDQGKGLRMGFGLNYSNLLFDYAYGGFGDFGAMHRISVSLRFGERMRQLNSTERSILKEAKAATRQGDYLQSIMEYNRMLEMDPTNDVILRRMVEAYDKLSKASATQAAQAQIAAAAAAPIRQTIPAEEQAALSALLPATTYGPKAPPAAAYKSNAFNPEDPLGLERLPDLANPDSVAELLAKAHEPASSVAASVTPPPLSAPSPAGAGEDRPVVNRSIAAEGGSLERGGGAAPTISQAPTQPAVASTSSSASGDTPALSPADIYGN